MDQSLYRCGQTKVLISDRGLASFGRPETDTIVQQDLRHFSTQPLDYIRYALSLDIDTYIEHVMIMSWHFTKSVEHRKRYDCLVANIEATKCDCLENGYVRLSEEDATSDRLRTYIRHCALKYRNKNVCIFHNRQSYCDVIVYLYYIQTVNFTLAETILHYMLKYPCFTRQTHTTFINKCVPLKKRKIY